MDLLLKSFHALRAPLLALQADGARVINAHRARGALLPRVGAALDASLWALVLLRLGAGFRGVLGTSLGTSTLLRLGFHIDVWSDAIGPGLRLPHPFNIIIGEGVEIGPACTLLHGVTLQNGSGTRVGQGVFLANGVTVLAGSRIGDGSLIGAASVVRGEIPPASVAVGAPARVVRATRPSEAAT